MVWNPVTEFSVQADRCLGQRSVIDYGADPTGNADSTAAIQTALDDLMALDKQYRSGIPTTLCFPAGTYTVSARLIWNGGLSAKVLGAGKWSTRLRWVGPADVDMLTLVNCRSIELGGFELDANGIALSSLLFLETNTQLQVAAKNTSTLDDIHDLILRGHDANQKPVARAGLTIDKDRNSEDRHNDYHHFRRLEIEGFAVAGIQIRQGQHKGSIFEMCNVGRCTHGLFAPAQDEQGNELQGGAFHWFGGFMHHNEADFTLSSVLDAVVISHMGSEGSRRFIDNPVDSGNGWPLTVLGCRWASTGLHTDRRMMILGKCGPYLMKGNLFGFHDTKSPQIEIRASSPSVLTLEDNHFESEDSAASDPVIFGNNAQLTCRLSKRRNTYRTNGGQKTMVHRPDEVGDIHFTTSNAPSSITELPLTHTLGIHHNLDNDAVTLAFNHAGAIRRVRLREIPPQLFPFFG